QDGFWLTRHALGKCTNYRSRCGVGPAVYRLTLAALMSAAALVTPGQLEPALMFRRIAAPCALHSQATSPCRTDARGLRRCRLRSSSEKLRLAEALSPIAWHSYGGHALEELARRPPREFCRVIALPVPRPMKARGATRGLLHQNEPMEPHLDRTYCIDP